MRCFGAAGPLTSGAYGEEVCEMTDLVVDIPRRHFAGEQMQMMIDAWSGASSRMKYATRPQSMSPRSADHLTLRARAPHVGLRLLWRRL